MNLYELSKTILLLSNAPVNKVRFARIIYFVHKELIRKKLMSPEDIAYIRSPLGPIPEGLLRLTLEHPNIIIHPAVGPSFAAEEFTIQPTETDETTETIMLEQYHEILSTTERTLKALSLYTTSELVKASHTDPSWLNNFNGAHFFITPADLKNPFPFITVRLKIRIKPAPNELGALQANLLRGMIHDIVKESTDLEYPDQISSNTAIKPNPLNIIAALPFRKHPKPSPSSSKTAQKSPKTTKNNPESAASPQKPYPKTEQNQNKRGKRAQQGTKLPLPSDADHSEVPASDTTHEGTK